MKALAHLTTFLLLVAYSGISNAIAQNLFKAGFVSLEAEVVSKGNKAEADGNLYEIDTPLLRLMRTNIESPKGTALILAGGGYEILKMRNEGEKTALFLNAEGFDAVVLEYRVSKLKNPNWALADALQAYRLLKTSGNAFGLDGKRLVLVGVSTGGHLAARLVQKLGDNEQPDDLILISPTNLDETPANSVFPMVRPPVSCGAQCRQTSYGHPWDKPDPTASRLRHRPCVPRDGWPNPGNYLSSTPARLYH
jgi:acetyl esterase/lipase